MSYCRWSSDNGNCDLYCYEDVDGYFVTMVAESRADAETPKNLSLEELCEWCDKHMIPIGLPYDGKTIEDSTLKGMLNSVLMLQGIGYRIPEWAVTNIRTEAGKKPKPSNGVGAGLDG